MGFFERYLTVWVALCIVAGIALGKVAPGGRAVARCDGDYGEWRARRLHPDRDCACSS